MKKLRFREVKSVSYTANKQWSQDSNFRYESRKMTVTFKHMFNSPWPALVWIYIWVMRNKDRETWESLKFGETFDLYIQGHEK